MPAVPAGRYAVFFAVAIVGCAVDLGTKSWIFDRLGMPPANPEQLSKAIEEDRKAIWIVEDIFGFETSLNEGALFGIGQGQTALFAALSVVAALGVLYWLFVAGGAEDLLLTVTLGMVTAGILGNLYDRVGMPGLKWQAVDTAGHQVGEPVYAVRDWLHFKIHALWGFDWPIFNIADSLLVCGAVLLVLHGLFAGREPDSSPGSESTKSASDG